MVENKTSEEAIGILRAAREADILAWKATCHDRPSYMAQQEAELRALPLIWRAIGSAPQDGSNLLVHCYWEPLTVVGKFKDGEWVVAWSEDKLAEGYEATHWTYLPGDIRDDLASAWHAVA